MADIAAAQGKEWEQFIPSPDNPYVQPEITDAPLTQKGRNQAKAAQVLIQSLEHQPELVVLSSNCRALQTGIIAFSHLQTTPFLAHELLREETGVHICDKRRPKSQQMTEFPQVNFDHVETEEDELFQPHRRESKMEIGERIYKFMEWLSLRKEKNVGIASHSGWLLMAFNGVLECEEGLRGWFQTGELRSVKLVFTRKE